MNEQELAKMPKAALSQAQKQLLSVQWIQQSGVAHTLKDLEKALRTVSSVGGMQMKDHIQSLLDENYIRVEKIGSGNWYWCFLSDEKIKKETALAKAKGERDKAQKTLEDLKMKAEEAAAAREEEENETEMSSGPDMSRHSLMDTHGQLGVDLQALRSELATYSENDPIEVERRKDLILYERAVLEVLTDQICSMEGWFKRTGSGDKVQLMNMKRAFYGDEFDEETGGLRDF